MDSYLDGCKISFSSQRTALALGIVGFLVGGTISPGNQEAKAAERTQKPTQQEPAEMTDNHDQSLTTMAPYGDMQLWYYNRKREFRYPIPTDFDFAYINLNGEPIVTGPIACAQPVVGGVGVVRLGEYKPVNGKFEFIDEEHGSGQSAIAFANGKLLFVYESRLRTSFFDDLATADLERQKPSVERIGLVDKNGEILSGCEWKSAAEYSEGLMAVRDSSGIFEQVPSFANWGYQNQNGKFVVPPKFGQAKRFSEGLAPVSLDNPDQLSLSAIKTFTSSDSHLGHHPFGWSYIDKTGATVIAGPFSEAEPFSHGLAPVMRNNKWGYVDKSGKIVIACQYDWASAFDEALAAVEKDELVGFIDRTGKVIIPFKFKDARAFGDGLAPATCDGRKWGYINAAGDFKIEPKFHGAFPFNGGMALAYIDRPKEVGMRKTDAAFHIQRAFFERTRGDFNNAEARYQSVLKCAPEGDFANIAKEMLGGTVPDHQISSEALELYTKGVELVGKGQAKEAEALYRQALKMDPEFHPASGALAYALIAQGRLDEAITTSAETLKKHPKYARGYLRIAQAFKAKGDNELAEKNFAEAKRLDPQDPALAHGL